VAASTYLGYSGEEERKAHIVIYHFTTKGRLDRSFGRGGMVALPGSGGYEALALAVAPDGGVVLAAGEDVAGAPKRKRLLVVRYTKTGRPDNSFGYEGVVARTWVGHDVIPPHTYVSPNGIVPSAIAFDARGDAVIAGSKYTYTQTQAQSEAGFWPGSRTRDSTARLAPAAWRSAECEQAPTPWPSKPTSAS
jgi:uncharacterized membrane protein